MRHFIYLLPLIVFISVYGLFKLGGSRIKYLAFFLLLFNSILVVRSYFLLYPYQEIYFNELIGGVGGAYGKFEIDNWGLAYKEAADWLNKRGFNEGVLSVYACRHPVLLSGSYANIVSVKDVNDADYVICWERFDDNEKIKGDLIHTVSRVGVPLVYVYATK